jgi:hypothetical protein
MTSYRDRIYLRYLDAIYKHVNVIDESGCERHTKAIERLYAAFLPKNKGARVLD